MFEDGLIYQEARMATESEIKGDLQYFDIYDETMVSKGGPILWNEKGMLYTDPGESHTLIVGDTGSGKTQGVILPLIYSCTRAEESMVLVDPKGELVRRMEPYLKSKGYKTIVLNFRQPHKSKDKWNPLGYVEQAYKRGQHDEAQMQLNDLLERLFHKRSSADKDKYWNESAGLFGEGCFELSRKLGEELSIKNLLRWRYERLPNGTMQSCYENLPHDSKAFQSLSGYFGLTAENTKTCILSTFDQLIRLFKASTALTNMLSASSFDLDAIGFEKTAVFLVVPDEKTTLHFLAILFIGQCYEILLKEAEKYKGKLPRKVNFILEEFCNMPKLNDIGPMLTAARSRNIRFHLVIQSYNQLIDKYNENIAKLLIDNCGNLIYLHSREQSFLMYLSEMAGNNEYGRPLLSTSRLQHLQKNEMVIFHNRCYPFITKNIPRMYEYPIYEKWMSDAMIDKYTFSERTNKKSEPVQGIRKRKV